MNLTAGTVVTIPDKTTSDQLKVISINELKDGKEVLKDGQVVIVSRSWMIERDERELKLMQTIEEMKIK